MQQVTLDEARERLADLFAAASGGEEVLISDGATSVQLVPRASTDNGAGNRKPEPASGFGSMKGTFHMAPDFNEPLEDFKEYM